MMKLIQKLIQKVYDHSRTLEERLFLLFVMLSLGGLALGILGGCVMGEALTNLVPMIAAFVLFVGISYATFHFRKVQIGSIIISVLIIYVVLPFNFLTSGGIYGGGPIWFLVGFVFVCLTVEGKGKSILLISGFLVYMACYGIEFFYPQLVVQHTLEMAYSDSFITLTVVSVIVSSMILFQKKIFRMENETTARQKKEIEELNQAQNRFFSSMSHEIRTPINTIMGLNEMILREDVSDEVADDAKNIQGASKMLLTLINDILDMSKIESGKMDIVPVSYDSGAMLSDIVNMIWVRAREKGLEFHINVEETLPAHLYGDEVRIKQILINVLNNAVKYTQEGSVTLSIQCQRTEPGQAKIFYTVADTGMGIKQESIPHLFSAFKRVDEEKNRFIEGTGLGLSIVKQLVDLMDGEIAVNSIYSKGSTFVITIPQGIVGEEEIGELDLENRHGVAKERDHYKQSFEAPKAHVLIVDDNATNLMVEQKLLRKTKIQVDTAASGAECLKKTLEKHYDVIFMDHLMPEMDGIECLHEIRSQMGGLAQNTPVVILTANAGGENMALYKREGFDGCLMKPVSGIQLETELLKHLPPELVVLSNTKGYAGVVQGPILEHTRKQAIMITTDSVSDLPKDMIDRHRIVVIPYRVMTDGGEFMDGVEIETDGVLSYLKDDWHHARSESPEVKAYEEFFAEQLTRAQSIIHISIAKNASGGYANALEAAKTFDNVTVVDSGHLSSGMGLLVLRAAELAAQQMSVEEIVEEIGRLQKKVQTSFIVEDTEYLARSGRLAPRIHTICKACMLHPMIVLKNSSMTVGAIRIGTKKLIWKKYVSSESRRMADADRRILFITHAGLSREELKEIEEMVRQKIEFKTVVYQKATPAIATNCGPGTFGLLYMLK